MARRTVVRSGASGRAGPQARKPGRQFTKRQVATFLSEFAGSCNVRRSCEVAGITSGGVYKLRKRDAAFAKAWDEALCEGYRQLELLMLERALAGVAGEDGEPGTRALQLTERSMLAMLSAHRQSVRDARAATASVADDGGEAIRAMLTAKLDEMHARLTGVDDSHDGDAGAGAEVGVAAEGARDAG